ncbi:tudor domain-containing protein 5 isoform X3 [Anolis carolinensis]|uniref:tudor domain-containing protein 5 isoform X3 n=1 Tax=Anolis carolinensis TaxID=28377 RepID=UPI0007DB8106|nr:PREDICTED: tudor domain-containing protein 5 isoform X3 [Anolis carolinensis]|eukprot:XP_016848505.1 PREDICTED: tudor domain-containing protein 5 isoform X3 [Anolis carolinensis]
MSDQEELMKSLKKEVRSLLTPAKEGLTPSCLEQEYRYLVGKQLPFRSLGYHSVMELVKDMPDVVKICPMANGSVLLKVIADECTKQIANLVSRQKSKPKPPFYRQRLNSMCRTGLLWHPQGSLSLPRRGRLPPTLPAIVKSELKELLKLSPVLLSNFDKTFFLYFGRKFEFSRYGFYSMSEVLNAASDIITVVQTKTGSLLTLKDSPPKKQTNNLPKAVIQPNEMKQTLHTAVLSPVVNTGLSTKDQTKDPKEKCDTSLPQLKMEPLLLKSKERFEQFSVDSPPPLPPPKLQKEMKVVLANKGPGGIVSSELKEKIKNIVAQHPEGLLVSKLPQEFEAHFKEALPIRKLGFLNLMELIGALNDVLHIECKEGKQDCLIFGIDSQWLINDEKENSKTVQSGLLGNEDTSDGHRLPCWDFPSEDTKNPVTKFNIITKMATPYLDMEIPGIMQEIVENEIPPDAAQDRSLFSLPELDKGTLMGVFVEYIVSPSQFYVRIYSAETSDKLQDMMIEMRCYSSKNVTDRYIISEALIQPGQLCCVRNLKGKWWYRGIIHQIIDDQKVEVFYPDFGNMDIVQKSSLRFLKDSYAKLPAQAIPCSLAWVKPTKDDWTPSALLAFQRLCELKLLVGVVDEYINGVLHLFLCDTSSDEDIYLHNILKLEGHAFIYSENIPSKGFKTMNFSALYLKPSPKQEADLTEKVDSLLQQESLGGLPDTTDLEFCKSEDVFQDIASPCLNSEMPYLEPVNLCKEVWDERSMPFDYYEEKKNCDTDDNLCSDIAVLPCPIPNCGENKNEILQSQDFRPEDTASPCLDSENSYLEPVCKEIWDNTLITSDYYEEKKNGDIDDNLCSDIEIFSCQMPNNEESKNETHPSQYLMSEGKDIPSDAVERKELPDLKPLNQILDSSEETEITNPVEATYNSSLQKLKKIDISIAHSEKSDPDQFNVNVNNCTFQSLASTSALDGTYGLMTKLGEASSEKKIDKTSRTQVVSLRKPGSYCGPNALTFTAELQGSSAFCVPCSPAVALGASARLAASGGYFSLSLRNMKTSGQMALGKLHCSAASLDTTVKKRF